MTASVLDDRLGARAGRIAITIAPPLGLASVILWLVTGGTASGGTMTPYVSLQAIGVALPPLVALLAPGRIPRAPLMAAVALFVLARIAGMYDRELLDAIAISGHSLKHVAAAAAAACVLGAFTSRASAGSPASS
jgi:hypothetical protein